jgi:hypothetical protein
MGANNATTARLFNYLVRTRYEPGRNFVTDRFGRLEIDDQLKPCRLFDRKIVRFGAAQHLGD